MWDNLTREPNTGGGGKEAAMTQYWDGTESDDFEPDEVFIGRYWGDVLRDDAFVTRDGSKSSSEVADGKEAE